MPTEFVILITTCPSRQEARDIAERLLAKRLIACANIIASVESIFRWKGRVDKAKEVVVTMKTKRSCVKSAIKAVRSIHSYDVPEIIAIPIVEGSRDYLGWIDENVGTGRE